jgi:hypothetical protein
MEFNLGLIPAGAKLSGATLQFYVDSMTGGSAGYPQPLIYGYAGNGVADVADASQTGALLATAPAVTGTGLVTINLNAAQLEALLAQGPYLGIMVRGSDNGEQFGFATTEGSVFGPAPTLSFAYATPEPGTILALLPVAACAALRRRRRGR